MILVAFAAWLLGLFGNADPAVAEAIQLSEQAFSPNLTEAQQSQYRDQLRQQIDALTPQQRELFFDANRSRFEAFAQQRMDAFFAMSKTDQQKRLDEIIDRMSQPRNNGRGNGERGPQAGRGDRGGWANMTEAQRDERSKRRLDRSSPKMRAQFSEFRKKLEARAKERGIQDLPGDFGRPRG